MVDKKLEKDDEVEDRMDVGDSENPDTVNGGQANLESQKLEGESEQQPNETEITQTDHLNKKLLEAFLSRINSSGQDHLPLPNNCAVELSEWAEDGGK